MRIIRQQRILGALLLAALLLAPVLASGHHHTNAASPCAVCAVARHTPVVTPTAIAAPIVVPVVVVVDFVTATAPVGPVLRHATSRGPPALLLSREA